MSLQLSDPQSWLIACEQIRQLANRYAVAMRHHDVDALAELFVDDVQVGRDRFGHDELRADFRRQLEPLGTTILHVTNQVIDVTDHDTAAGLIGTRAVIERDEAWFEQLIEYRDTYARRDGRWLFVRRIHDLLRETPM